MLMSMIVSFDDQSNDKPIMIVGKKSRKMNQPLEIVNAFQGEEALELFERLTTIKGEENEEEDHERRCLSH